MVLSNRLTPAAPSCGVKALGESGSVGIQASTPMRGSGPIRPQRGIGVVASKVPGGPGEHFYVSIAEAARQHQKSYNILWNAVTLGTKTGGYYWRRDEGPRRIATQPPLYAARLVEGA